MPGVCTAVSCAASVLLAVASSLAFLGALSCGTHALLVASPSASASGSSAALQPASSAAALASLALLCVFVGGINVALRICSLGMGVTLLAAHLWMRTATPMEMARGADAMLRGFLLPARDALQLGEPWDCVFLGPADALYMLAAMRHAAAVLASVAGSLQHLAAGVRGGPDWAQMLGGPPAG
jgi:hypothetical protein